MIQNIHVGIWSNDPARRTMPAGPRICCGGRFRERGFRKIAVRGRPPVCRAGMTRICRLTRANPIPNDHNKFCR